MRCDQLHKSMESRAVEMHARQVELTKDLEDTTVWRARLLARLQDTSDHVTTRDEREKQLRSEIGSSQETIIYLQECQSRLGGDIAVASLAFATDEAKWQKT